MRNSNPSILVIDDSDQDRELLLRAFRQIGVTTPVNQASSAVEAIAYLKGEGPFSDRNKFAFPTVIITDLDMKAGDGFDVLQFRQSHKRSSVVPIIVLSGSLEPNNLERALALGASACHVKPNTYRALVHQLIILHGYWSTTEIPDQLPETGFSQIVDIPKSRSQLSRPISFQEATTAESFLPKKEK